MAVIKNNKYLVAGVFLVGTVFGAVASEQLANGLYEFKAGDPIVAAEVNANFQTQQTLIEELQGKVLELEKHQTESLVTKRWNCEGADGSSGAVEFKFGGGFEEISGSLYAGEVTGWEVVEKDKIKLMGTQDYPASVSQSDDRTIALAFDEDLLPRLTCTSW